jgi:hypothetical protein
VCEAEACPALSATSGKAAETAPALRQTICPVCCGTKRLTEIACPDDCRYLSAAREHPAAVVRRQQEQDLAHLVPSIRHLTERQYQLFFVLHTAIAQHQPEGLTRLLDGDVADAAMAVAATLETAARGVLYEHEPATLPAKRLAGDLRTMLAKIRERGAAVSDREAAIVLRAIEQGARNTPRTAGGDTAYLSLVARLLQVNRAAQQVRAAEPMRQGSIIIP